MSHDTVAADAFGRVPYWILDTGLVAAMSDVDAKVYLVVAAHVNGRSWDASPGQERIAQLVGKTERTVRRSLRRLETRGLIQTKRGSGPQHPNTYTLAMKPDTLDVRFAELKTGQIGTQNRTPWVSA